MRFLLTSAGVTNGRIRAALADLLEKPVGESAAICIPTASYGLPGGPGRAWRTLRSFESLGWREFGVMDLATLATAPESCWLPALTRADCVIVGDGSARYLAHQMAASGMAERLTGLLWDRPRTVFLGAGAGSMIVTRGLQPDDEDTTPAGSASDRALELLDLIVWPHQRGRLAPVAAALDVPLYAIDDESAVVVRDGAVRVVSEGEWAVFAPRGQTEHAVAPGRERSAS
jgi:dipeptidase E